MDNKIELLAATSPASKVFRRKGRHSSITFDVGNIERRNYQTKKKGFVVLNEI
jgi:hypothetical protein